MSRRSRYSTPSRNQPRGWLALLIIVSVVIVGGLALQRPQPTPSEDRASVPAAERDQPAPPSALPSMLAMEREQPTPSNDLSEEAVERVSPTPTVSPPPLVTQPAIPAPVLQDTNYLPPTNAFFVAPTGDDRNAGTQRWPWRTIGHAVAAAPYGATIVLRGGEYREGGIEIATSYLTLQPYPHEQVWLKGSTVIDTWQGDGAAWRAEDWTPAPAYEPHPDALDPEYPLARHPDQVFVNGVPLQQVATRDAVRAGTFFIDYERSQLFIGDDPHGKLVEASAHAQALMIQNAFGTKVRGLGFTHYATPPQRGALETDSPGTVFEYNTAAFNAGAGFSVTGADNVVRNNISVGNGQLGLHGVRADRLLMEQNYLAYNNQKRFSMQWEAGGAKVVRSTGMVWLDNVVEHNGGNGLWCDIDCYTTTMVHNVIRNNARAGVSFEISARGVIASNVLVHNIIGININESSEVDVYNNTMVENDTNLRVYEGYRTNSDPVTGDRIPWDTEQITVQNNIIAGGRAEYPLVVVDDFTGDGPQKDASAMLRSFDNNAYYRHTGSQGLFVRLSVDGKDVDVPSLSALRSFGYEASGFTLDERAFDAFYDAVQGDYRMSPPSAVQGAGTPLPPTVAEAIGVPAGVPVDVGALLHVERSAAYSIQP